MSVQLTPELVFTPNSFPAHSYVQRQFWDTHAQDYFNPEEKLREALATPGMFISIVGPSKSGKTISVKSVVGDSLIEIPGSELADHGDFWLVALKKLGIALEEKRGDRQTMRTGREVEFGLEAGIPNVIKVSAKDKDIDQQETATEVVGTFAASALEVLVAEGAKRVFLLDDFHYLPGELQKKVARQVKSAAERGLFICVAEVPHGDHSLIRSNPDLAGRYDRIDFAYWQSSDIEKIAVEGFNQLGFGVTGSSVAAFAEEAAGSPQLMQRICLAAARYLIARAGSTTPGKNEALSNDERRKILLRASSRDREKVIEALIKGPPTRGQERKPYQLRDGSEADVYESILLAVTSDPPQMSFTKGELSYRLGRIVRGQEFPPPSSIASSLKQMLKVVEDLDPGIRLLDLEENDTFHIMDPYFFNELRWYQRHRDARNAMP